MLSKVVSSFVLRTHSARLAAPLLLRTPLMLTPQRFFIDKLGLESFATDLATPQQLKAGEVTLWKDQEKREETALVLKDKDQIEKYVISIVKNYFRTTKKAKVGLESLLTEHGLDSLDQIELVIQIEDELGYVIDAENLGKFTKPKHFVNFITQMEAYKHEFHRLPHQDIHEDFSFRAAFPGLPGDKSKKAEHH